MSYTSTLFKIASVTLLIFALSVLAFADTIKLKDGSMIKGKILSFENGQFIILIGEGDRQRQIRFFSDEIESIEFDSQPVPMGNADAETEPSPPNYSKTTDGDSTIITIGSTSKTPGSTTKPEIISTNSSTPPSSSGGVRPIEIKVQVLADNTANGWTNAGWVVKRGQKIRITGVGRISLGNGRFSGPRGISTLPDQNKLIGEEPTGGLIAVIGDDNNEFIFVGDSLEFVAERDGALFLGVNEGVLDDNSGSFDVTVQIDPNIGG